VTFYYVLHLYERELLAGFQPRIYMGRHKRTRNLRACLRSGHVILVNASWMQRWLDQSMGIESDLLIGGVNFDLFHPVDNPPRNDAAARVLASGDPREGKGSDTVEAAMELVCADRSHAVLDTYYGRGIAQEEMAAVYASADVFADASRNSGGWNNPVAEAMACGVPVACTQNGQVEDFAFDGRTALLSPPNDARALADNILRLLDDGDLRERLSAEALRHIRTFRWEDAIDRFEALAEKYMARSVP
jgi:glycosyltransferase involved in cell wall biosynthesis